MHIVHLLTSKQLPLATDYMTIYDDLHNTYPTLTIHIFSKSPKKREEKKNGIYYHTYTNYEDLLQQIRVYEPVHILTVTESLVPTMHKLKRDIGQARTRYFPIFTNKAKERSLLHKHFPEIVPQALVLTNHLPLAPQVGNMEFPVMIKPVAGVGSKGVKKAYNIDDIEQHIHDLDLAFASLEEKGISNKSILIEEFIEGPQFVINYRVDSEQNIYPSLITHVKTTQEIAIPGRGNRYRIIAKKYSEMVDTTRMHDLMNKTVTAGNIKNTYISHNFRITPRGTYKTIEINGRIGGYRLEMNRYASNYNLLDVILNPHTYQAPQIKKHVMTMSIRGHTEGVLTAFDDTSITMIQQLPSFQDIRLQKKYLHKTIRYATHGGQPVGTIICVHDNEEQLEKDIATLTTIYKNICVITPNI